MYSRDGYIALLTVLIVSVIAATTILILFVTSLNTTLNSGNVYEGKAARLLADACAELALQSITNGSSAPCPAPCEVAAAFSQGQCNIVEITDLGGGNNWRIRTTGSGVTNSVVKRVEIEAYRLRSGSAAVVTSWDEVVSF
jgi:hypothetical protein